MQLRRLITWPVILMFSIIVFGGVFVGFMVFMKSIAPYEQAMERARANQDVVSVTGTPIEGGWFISGSASGSGGGTKADLNWSIEGPDGEGTLHVEATGSDDEWEFHSLTFEFDDGAEVDLLR